jgi:hypothetical protein
MVKCVGLLDILGSCANLKAICFAEANLQLWKKAIELEIDCLFWTVY